MSVELTDSKKRFLERTNRSGTRDRAKSAAVAAASQHNLLYAPGLDEQARRKVRGAWMERLDQVESMYAKGRSALEYESDVEALRGEMNREFSGYFCSGNHRRYRYDAGFRISHAQKSLSVYLKHLWCLDKIDTPPECPVDSVVLRRAGLAYPDTR